MACDGDCHCQEPCAGCRGHTVSKGVLTRDAQEHCKKYDLPLEMLLDDPAVREIDSFVEPPSGGQNFIRVSVYVDDYLPPDQCIKGVR
jgi:hypothetical protein